MHSLWQRFAHLITVDADIDISQLRINQQCARYLELLNRDPVNIKNWRNEGVCMGFTVLVLYSMWLLFFQPERFDHARVRILRDDWLWLKRTLIRISKWDGSLSTLTGRNQSAKKLRDGFERFIGLAESFQNSDDYTLLGQMDVHQYLQDTRHRCFRQEFVFRYILRASDFHRSLALDNDKKNVTLLRALIKGGRLVFIGSENHILGVIKVNTHYIYYNSNVKNACIVYQEKELTKVVENFFTHLSYQQDKLSRFEFYIFAEASLKAVTYPTKKSLIEALDIRDTQEGETEVLQAAVDYSCEIAAAYCLLQPPMELFRYVNEATNGENGKTVLHRAVSHQNDVIIQLLLDVGSDIHVRDHQGNTPLHLAVMTESLCAVTLLLKHGANLHMKNAENKSSLVLAVEKNFLPILLHMLSHDCLRVTMAEYKVLLLFYERYPLCMEVRKCLDKNAPLLLLQGMRDQLAKEKASHLASYKKTLQKINSLENKMNETPFREYLLKILKIMIPLLERLNTSKRDWYSLWQPEVLVEKVKKMACELGLLASEIETFFPKKTPQIEEVFVPEPARIHVII